MSEYVMALCKCGMSVDDAFIIVRDIMSTSTAEELENYIEEYRVIHETLMSYVD